MDGLFLGPWIPYLSDTINVRFFTLRLIGLGRHLQKNKKKRRAFAPLCFGRWKTSLWSFLGALTSSSLASSSLSSSSSSLNYERIYWISAVDQVSMLSGYQKIAKGANLHRYQLCPREIAETVIAWLTERPSWLVVVDNLDDYRIANGLPPIGGPHKHMLITRRNPNTSGIPAEPLKVPLLNADDSIELLLAVSRITNANCRTTRRSQKNRRGAWNAASSNQISSRLYQDNNRWLESLPWRLSQESQEHTLVVIRQPAVGYNIASTWSMSFDILRKSRRPSAALLFHLFSYMNPDGI